MTRRAVIELTLTLRSPFLMQGLNVSALGVDASALRNEAGRPLVPADQVKGLLRAACVTLACATNRAVVGFEQINDLFGRPSPKRDPNSPDEQDAPARGALIFDDLVAEKPRACGTITRVHIDPVTGAAKTGHLQTVELVAPLGAEVTFTGRVIARLGADVAPAGEPDPARWVADLLHKALRLVPAVGALKSAGFGEVVAERSAAVLVEGPADLALPQPRGLAYGRRAYRVTFDRRVLVDSERLAENVWRGSAVVPGTVFKGALAERLKLAGVDPQEDPVVGDALEKIRFSHAFPGNAAGKLLDMPLPLSLFMSEDRKRVADALVNGRPGLAPRLDGEGVPTFQSDWKDKDWKTVRRELEWAEPDGPAALARGHVEIGQEYVAAEGQLFVDVARAHLVGGDPAIPRCWYLTVHRNDADAKTFGRILAILEDEGLDGIGSTGARACFHANGQVPRGGRVVEVIEGSGLWAVTLATPAMMLDPQDLRDEGAEPDLFAAYAAYWRTALGDKTELVNFYARQRLTGGYLAVRRRLYGRGVYYPFLLTEPGSVFLLKGDLKDGLTRLVNSGLPVKKVRNADGPVSWRNCPYMPENGYGEIIVNAVDHADLAKGVTHD